MERYLENKIMKQSHKLTKEQKIEIIQKYKTGNCTCVSLGKEYNMSHNGIRYLLVSNNIVLKTMSQAKIKYSLNEHYFNIIDTEDKAYFLGLLYADGYNNEKENIITLSLQEDDIGILKTFNNFLSSNRPILSIISKKKNRKILSKLSIRNKNISTNLSYLGCKQKKSFILTFPTTDKLPESLIKHFIRGYFDGLDRKATGKIADDIYILNIEKRKHHYSKN